MPNKCTRCGRVYEEGSDVILTGCECGNRLFFYFRKVSDEEAEGLVKEGTKEIQESAGAIIGIKNGEPVVDKGSDIWNIRVKEGVYEIDIASLMGGEPIIVAGEEGRYLVSLSSIFKKKRKK
ncbi:MAG: Zn-ribbon domain-containing protein [Candidatus Hydrothermarchaeales archaeon]